MAPRAQKQRDDRVAAAINALRAGQPVLVYDADGREEETDIVIAAEHATADAIRLMRTDAGGLLCATLAPHVHMALGLPYQSDLLVASGHPLLAALADAEVPYEKGASKPSFAIGVNHRDTYTGITDADRALTLRALAEVGRDATMTPTKRLRGDFVKRFKAPGHVFLLNAHPNLLEARRGHTELATALVEMAGLAPVAAICEMMGGPDGAALPKPDAVKYAAKNGLVFLEGKEVFDAWKNATRAARA